jgi:hypothetical protein
VALALVLVEQGGLTCDIGAHLLTMHLLKFLCNVMAQSECRLQHHQAKNGKSHIDQLGMRAYSQE